MSELVSKKSANDEIVQRLITTFGSRQVTNIEFCRALKFNKDELKYAFMFSDPVFNKSMIYLSDEIILDMLTEETGKDAIQHFYERKLIPRYSLYEDYIEIDRNHALVQAYLRQAKSPKLAMGSRKRFFAVTGECFKCMLMESVKGKIVRKYYLKVEQAVYIMKDFVVAQKARELELERRERCQAVLDKEYMEYKTEEYFIERLCAGWCNVDLSKFARCCCVYLLYVGEYISNDGLVVHVFKFGRSEDMLQRFGDHKRTFESAKLVFCHKVLSGLFVENMIKDFARQHGLKCEIAITDDHTETEIIMTNSEVLIVDIITELTLMCNQCLVFSETDVLLLQKDKDLSDCKAMCAEYKARAEVAEMRTQLAVAQTEAKLYKDMSEKFTLIKKEEKHDTEQTLTNLTKLEPEPVSAPENSEEEIDESKLVVETEMVENKDEISANEEDTESEELKPEKSEIEETETKNKKPKAEQPEDIQKRTCPQCKKVYSTPAGMRRHVRGKHEGKYKKWCKECERFFYDAGSYSKHVNEVHKQILRQKCPECKKTYACKATLDRHLEIVHGGAKKECPECHKVMSAGALGVHLKEKHSDELKVECEECGEILGNKKYLKAHIEQVHFKVKIKCTICDSDVLKYQLNKHMHAEHPDELARRKSVTPSDEDTEESDA